MLAAVRGIASDLGVASTLVDGTLVCRCIAGQALEVRHALTLVWQQLRPLLLARPAVLPRIWST
jgi:urease accessory protein UreH